MCVPVWVYVHNRHACAHVSSEATGTGFPGIKFKGSCKSPDVESSVRLVSFANHLTSSLAPLDIFNVILLKGSWILTSELLSICYNMFCWSLPLIYRWKWGEHFCSISTIIVNYKDKVNTQKSNTWSFSEGWL